MGRIIDMVINKGKRIDGVGEFSMEDMLGVGVGYGQKADADLNQIILLATVRRELAIDFQTAGLESVTLIPAYEVDC